MNDKALLKLLEAGVEAEVAAKQLNVASELVVARVRVYVEEDILKCVGDREVIDWKAYGRWKRRQLEAA